MKKGATKNCSQGTSRFLPKTNHSGVILHFTFTPHNMRLYGAKSVGTFLVCMMNHPQQVLYLKSLIE
jgi:hypothetical protein